MILRKQDLLTAQKESWYRIPVKSAPEVVKSGALTTLALYQTKAFDEEKYSVRWWGAVSKIDRKKRVELLPNEPAHPRANEEYFVVRVHAFKQLPKPVLSRIPRRNPFITTTDERLFAAKDYNDLFYGSPLEETLWSALRKEGIPAQREYMVSRTAAKKKESFYLDFTLFCKDINIAVECDGAAYHESHERIEYDKDRDVKVQNMRFVVYRFTTNKIMNHLEETVLQIKRAVQQYGGVVDALDPSKTLYMPPKSELPGQELLFG
jgi:very-short-patch-repair endonuclease